MDRSTPLAATATLSEAGWDIAGSSPGNSELLPDEGTPGCRRSREREHQVPAAPRPRLSEPALSTVEGATHGGDQDRIRGLQKSSLKCGSRRILAESLKTKLQLLLILLRNKLAVPLLNVQPLGHSYFLQGKLPFDCLQRANGSAYTTPANHQQKAANARTGNCRIEPPPIQIFLVTVFSAVFGGFSFALWAILKFDNNRPRLCTYLGIAGIGCAELGLLFLVMGGLHPYTWGLPPQWLPAKWNPCPQDYRDYSPHREIVTQKHLTSSAFPYYNKTMANILPTEKQVAIIGSLCEGSSIRAIERMTGVHRDTVMRLGVRVGQGCTAMMSEALRDLNCTRLEMDEIWG